MYIYLLFDHKYYLILRAATKYFIHPQSCSVIYQANLPSQFTKLRFSSHKFLVERARWLKVKVPYTQRTCTLCNSNDIEDEYHVTLVCEYFRDVRKKYIKPFYYQRPNMMKFLDLMTSVSKKDRFRLMFFFKLFLKCMQKHYDV